MCSSKVRQRRPDKYYSCRVPLCRKRAKITDIEACSQLHKFPLENVGLKRKWLKALRLHRVHIHYRICSRHFETTDFSNIASLHWFMQMTHEYSFTADESSTLKPNAVPSLYLHGPTLEKPDPDHSMAITQTTKLEESTTDEGIWFLMHGLNWFVHLLT